MMGSMSNPLPSEVVDMSVKVNALLRAIMLDPRFAYKTVGSDDKWSDPANTPPQLTMLYDFVRKTYMDNCLPLLPPNATKSCRALANPHVYNSPEFQENDEAMSEDKYPKISGSRELQQKYQEALGRATMAGMMLLDREKGHLLFGGAYDFGEEIEKCARDLTATE